MKNPFRFSILPYFTMGAGGIGLCLRVWLFSATDENGLLPASHPADILTYLLTALVFAALFLITREASTSPYRRNFRRTAEIIGNTVGALGLLLHAFVSKLSVLTFAACIAGCLALLTAALFAFRRKAFPYWLGAVVTVVLMVVTVIQCRQWGSIPQLQYYLFPLLASIFLILTAYYRTTLAARQGNRGLLAFFSQGALFLCCLSLNSNPVLYFPLACWAAVQLFPCYRIKKES